MPLLKNFCVVDDPWIFVGDDQAPPPNRAVILALPRLLREEGRAIAEGEGRLGVRMTGADDVSSLAGWLPRLDTIVLEFPKFSDGRAYSTARILRERYGYRGELRATGEVLIDQIAFMLQCGFDAFELPSDQDWGDWRDAASAISLHFQSDIRFSRATSVLEARHETRRRQQAA